MCRSGPYPNTQKTENRNRSVPWLRRPSLRDNFALLDSRGGSANIERRDATTDRRSAVLPSETRSCGTSWLRRQYQRPVRITVTSIDRRPNRRAAAQSGMYTSMRRLCIRAPVSSTRYVPSYDAAPSMRITVPSGRTAGSAATMPFDTRAPDAVTRPVQYAVAMKRNGAAAALGGTCGVGTGWDGWAHAEHITSSISGPSCRPPAFISVLTDWR